MLSNGRSPRLRAWACIGLTVGALAMASAMEASAATPRPPAGPASTNRLVTTTTQRRATTTTRPTTTTTARRTTTTTVRPTTTTTVRPTTTTTTRPTTTTTVAPTTTTSTTAPPPVGPCGGVPSVTGRAGATWRCTFSDEFSGSSLDPTRWLPQLTANSGYTHGGACFVDDPDNIAVGGGVLSLTARTEAAPFSCGLPWGEFTTSQTSGMVSTWARFSQTYGRFEIRARFPDIDIPGIHGALWMFPQYSVYGQWPLSGEIDIAEVYSQYNDRAIPFVHYADGGLDTSVTNNYCMLDPTQFHTYAAEWTPESITILFDGNVCLVNRWSPLAPLTGRAPFDQPFIVALTQSLGVGTNAFAAATTPLPATTVVDYVRVWG